MAKNSTSNAGRDLTVGSIPKHLFNFFLPMLLGNFINTLYNIVDTMWVGKIVGHNAVGATGVSFPVMFMLIAVANGATIATTILVSQYFGAKNYEMVKKTVNNSFIIAIVLSIIIMAIGISCSGFILKLMNTPEEIFDLAKGYLRISLYGFGFQYLSFLIMSILRGIGDTVTPLLFMTFGAVLNGILDPFFIIGIGPIPEMGLNGAAWASFVSLFISLIFGFIYLSRKDHIILPKLKEMKFDKNTSLLIFKIGFPSMIQQSLVSLGAAFMTGLVNGFGSLAIAAFGATNRVESIVMMTAMSLSASVASLSGQNIGAKKFERVNETFKWGLIIGIIISGVLVILIQLFPHFLMSLFINEEDVVDIGVTYLRIVSLGYIMLTVMFISNGVINGAGKTRITMIFSLLSLWVVRVPLASVLSKTSLGITGLWWAYVISFSFVMCLSLIYYFLGRWKRNLPIIINNDHNSDNLVM